MWLRCVAIAGAILAGLVAWFIHAYPGVPVGLPIRQMLIGLVLLPGVLAVQLGVMLMTPPRISVSAKRIHISHGNSAFIVKPDRLVDAAVEFDQHERPVLRMSYRAQRLRKSKLGPERTRVHAIGAKVDLVELEEMLGALMARRSGGGSADEPQMAQMDPDQTDQAWV